MQYERALAKYVVCFDFFVGDLLQNRPYGDKFKLNGGNKMRKNISILRLSIGFCALLVAALFANFGFAQDQAAAPAPQLYRMTVIQVNPGMEPDFEYFVKSDLVPALKKGGVQQFNVWSIDIFGEAGKYLFVSPLGSIGALDDNPVAKAIGQESMGALLRRIRQLAASIRTVAFLWRPDLGTDLEPGYVPKLGILMTATVAPGREQEYEENLKKVGAIIGKTNAKGVLASKIMMGGVTNEYTALIWLDSFADMEKFAQAFTKGLSEAKLPAQTGVVVKQQIEVYRNIPELSIQPATQ